MSLASYKVTIKKSIIFLHTINGQLDLFLKIAFIIVNEVVINLTSSLQVLYVENYKTPLKENKEDLNQWKDIHVHELEDSKVFKYQFSPT